ncbi:hypothetical protein V6N13_125550 [Hibiscus sabdariffa]
MLALRTADVGGNFDLVVERPNATDIPKFMRIYVCFSALMEGFKMYCRPVVGLDGCFLKSSFKGEILSAVGRDCSNQNFPIAWAVVEVENRKTWAWFLNNLQHDLSLGDEDGCTLLNDMQKMYHFASQQLRIDVMLGICMSIRETFTKEVTCSCYSGSAARIERKLEEHKKLSSACHVICNGAERYEVENHGPSPTPSAPPSSQTSHIPSSSEIPYVPSSQTSHVPQSSQISSPPSSQIPSTPQSTPTMVFMPTPSTQQLSELGRPSQVLLSRPHTRSFIKPTSQPTSTTATPPVVVPLSASSEPDATATVSPKARLPKLPIKRHPPKN